MSYKTKYIEIINNNKDIGITPHGVNLIEHKNGLNATTRKRQSMLFSQKAYTSLMSINCQSYNRRVQLAWHLLPRCLYSSELMSINSSVSICKLRYAK